ncbi:NAD(P)-binding protein [Sistotremastrum suecicum HHB10207 ss-3]|uniref:NAD(P)-binding protein n=1 Tax=Sistotremastrum suecicum HHB10207 ss-3 TaxID=1314776 RepID=A0A166DP01_9AGAM|nr:NAD(P)-binding protein [Sistotremastrum suecicum HHB10207 ss-3]
MSTTHVLAIIGATGQLGGAFAEVVTEESYTQLFPSVRILTRDASSYKAQYFQARSPNVQIVQCDLENEDSVNQALEGVDALVSVLGSAKDQVAKEMVLKALVKNRVKLYIPSEFGAERINFDFESAVFASKEAHLRAARVAGNGFMKVVAINVGHFMEDSSPGGIYGSVLGFDHANLTYTAVGSPTTPVTYVSVKDIARSTARIVQLSLDSSLSATVPNDVRIAGSVVSYQEVAQLAENITGKKIKVESLDLAEFRGRMLKEKGWVMYFRYAMGKGWMDYSNHNERELVNPGQSLWKWKTMEDYLKEAYAEGKL